MYYCVMNHAHEIFTVVDRATLSNINEYIDEHNLDDRIVIEHFAEYETIDECIDAQFASSSRYSYFEVCDKDDLDAFVTGITPARR